MPITFEPDPVVEAYKKNIDRAILRENLKLSPEQRLLKMQTAVRSLVALQEAFKGCP